MRFAPLAIVVILFAAHALLTGAWAREAFDYSGDAAIWRAIFYVELALPLFVLWPSAAGRRRDVGEFLLGVLACAGASSAVMFALAYLSSPGPAWQTRPVVLAAWALCGGVMAIGARLGGAWPARARLALVCVLGLPLLWHYFSLEYAQKSQLGLQALSPHWYLAANATLDGGPVVAPLAIAGALAMAAASALPRRKEAP